MAENKVIVLRGVERAGADEIQTPGGLEQCIGMEAREGSLVPYAMTEQSDVNMSVSSRFAGSLNGFVARRILIHKTSSNAPANQNVIIHATTSNYIYHTLIWVRKIDWDSDTTVLTPNFIIPKTNTEPIRDIKQVGNMLCVSTDEGIRYFLWKGDDYTEKNRLLSNLPTVNFRVNKGLYSEESSDYMGVTDYTIERVRGFKGVKDILVSDAIKILGVARQSGGLTGAFIVCSAWRLRNGALVSATPLTLLNFPDVQNEGYYYGYNIVSQQDEKITTTAYPSGIKIDNGNHILTPFHMWSGSADLDYNYIEYNQFKTLRICNYAYPLTNIAPQDYVYPPLLSVAFKAHNEGTQASMLDGDWMWETQMLANVTTNKLQYNISQIPSGLEDEVSSLCIFISPQVDCINYPDKINDVNINYIYQTGEGYDGQDYFGHITCKFRSPSEIIDDIKEINNLYKIKEIPISDLDSTGWIDIDLEGKLGDNLLVREPFSVTAWNFNEGLTGMLENYNMRLHVSDYKYKLFGGFKLPEYAFCGGYGQYATSNFTPITQQLYSWEIDVEIEDPETGLSKIVTSNSGLSTFTKTLGSILFYPNLFATKIRIRYQCTYQDEKKYVEFPLTRWDNMQGAYYISPDLKPIDITDGAIAYTSDTFPVEKNYNDVRIVRNGIRVSDAAFPTYFPAKNTETFGNDEIIGLAILTQSLNQDRYGAKPLLIFCTDGIWSVNVDTTGNVAYTDKQPFGREVCINRKTICSIDGAVLFASKRGLMIAQLGNIILEFCPSLNGDVRHLPVVDSQKGIKNGLHLYRGAVTHTNIVGDDNATIIPDIDFRDYLYNATVSYVSEKNKVIVYRSDKPYYYWIDIPTRIATIIPAQLIMDDDNYPTEVYYGYGFQSSFTAERLMDESDSSKCVLQTRPIKLTEAFQSLQRVAVRGKFCNMHHGEGDRVGIYVLGSLDGETWRPIGGYEKVLNEVGFHDLDCKTERDSYKYAMIIVAGQLDKNSHIDSIELTASAKYSNKLR